MANFCRVLDTDLEVEYFVDGVLCIDDKNEKRSAINNITAAERNIKDYKQLPTLTHRDNRDFAFRDEKERLALRKQIIKELQELPRLDSDDDIVLGAGGAMPKTTPKREKKAFYIIGPPAAGKSGVAAKVADLFGAYLLDSDFAKRKLPEYANQIGSASLVHEESDALVFHTEYGALIDYCINQSLNMVIPKIGHKLKDVITFCETVKKIGYSVYLISVDLDRQKATQRAYNRYVTTKRYVPLSLVFDGYGDQPTLNYFKIKQQYHNLYNGFAQISTDVAFECPSILVESENMDELSQIDWR